jgi:hypothetical protein
MPSDFARLTVLSKIDDHIKTLLSHSPFLLFASFGSDGSDQWIASHAEALPDL